MKPLHYITMLFAFISNMFNFKKFKDGTKANLSQTTKGGINPKHLTYLKEDKKCKMTNARRQRYSGIKKYHKVPTIQA